MADDRIALLEEFERLNLGDLRLHRRVRELAMKLAERPSATLPNVAGSEAMLEGAYRLLSNERVVLAKLIAPHARETVRRAQERGRVLAIHDTTDIEARAASAEDVGYLNTGKPGFYAHFSMIVAQEDLAPLGVTRIETYRRAKAPTTRKPTGKTAKKSGTDTRKNKNRESLRWSRGVEQAQSMLENVPYVVHVMDREADIYELMSRMGEANDRFVIRLRVDRRARASNALTRATRDAFTDHVSGLLSREPVRLEREVRLSRRALNTAPQSRRTHPPRESRMAHLEVRAAAVKLAAPQYIQSPRELPIHIVHVRESDDVPEPVEWTLVTSEPIATAEDVAAIVDMYRARWQIEELFKAIKTGCAYEKRMLRDPSSLENLLAITTPIAYRMLLLRNVSRTQPTAKATTVLTKVQLEVLRRKLPKRVPAVSNVGHAMAAIAELGGHQRNNGPPGWLVLYRGVQKLLALEEGYALARKRPKRPLEL